MRWLIPTVILIVLFFTSVVLGGEHLRLNPRSICYKSLIAEPG